MMRERCWYQNKREKMLITQNQYRPITVHQHFSTNRTIHLEFIIIPLFTEIYILYSSKSDLRWRRCHKVGRQEHRGVNGGEPAVSHLTLPPFSSGRNPTRFLNFSVLGFVTCKIRMIILLEQLGGSRSKHMEHLVLNGTQ
jgi:hypothetical protein